MNNIEKIIYTYKHHKLMIYLSKKYFSDNAELIEQMEKHDFDKLFMYMFYDRETVSNFHRLLSTHHDNELEKNKLDYIEMALDWESARYSKPDKPLNAYDTLYKYYPHLEDKILPILKEIGLNKSRVDMEEDVINYLNTINNVTIKEIKKEMLKYIEDSLGE